MNTMRTAMLLAFMTALFMGVGFLIGGRGGMMIAFVIAAGMNFFSYWNSDKMVLRAYRARRSTSGRLPNSTSWCVISPAMQTCRCRRSMSSTAAAECLCDRSQSSKCRGCRVDRLLQRLTPEEVAGVMAHELAHIENRDTLTMTITATLAARSRCCRILPFSSPVAGMTATIPSGSSAFSWR